MPRLHISCVTAVLLISAPLIAAPAHPDISGIWTRGGAAETAFAAPPSGPGPVMNLRPTPPGAGAGGELVINHWQGDYNAPILQPWAAEKVRAHTEADRVG